MIQYIVPFLILNLGLRQGSFSQNRLDSITEDDVSRTLTILASDSLKGRGNYTPDLLKATHFITNEFSHYGLQPFSGSVAFFQPFTTRRLVSRDVLTWNGKEVNGRNFIYFTNELTPAAKSLSDFTLIEIESALPDSLLYRYGHVDAPVLLWFKKDIGKKEDLLPKSILFPGVLPSHAVLLVASSQKPETMTIKTNKEYAANTLFNVVGVLPGKSKANEVVIFSAHYDHLGGEVTKRGDAIYNGANDNASGTAALLALANYYSERKDNERTVLFCAFAGEESGLLGSATFADELMPDHIKAVINIEMIGRAQWGKNNLMITGASYSTFATIFKKSMNDAAVKIISESSPEAKLFFRSDNYPFALKGVPAHTIMTSDDKDGCYHQPCDEVKRLDIKHITSTIRSIIKGSESIINGSQTPSRINRAMIASDNNRD